MASPVLFPTSAYEVEFTNGQLVKIETDKTILDALLDACILTKHDTRDICAITKRVIQTPEVCGNGEFTTDLHA